MTKTINMLLFLLICLLLFLMLLFCCFLFVHLFVCLFVCLFVVCSFVSVADNDYKPMMTILTIPQGTTLDSFISSSYCVNVTIIGDDIRELNESFKVVFNAYPDVFQGADNMSITILNDGDGKSIYLFFNVKFDKIFIS